MVMFKDSDGFNYWTIAFVYWILLVYYLHEHEPNSLNC
jgi:hypothetical protein